MNAKVVELLDACLDIFLDDYRPQGITGAEDIEEGFELWMQQQVECFCRECSWDGCYAYWQFNLGVKARQLKMEQQDALAHLRAKYPDYSKKRLKGILWSRQNH